jgi:peptidoglycan hydrolase-like protein with peptidoglycan-binding domain
VRISADPRSPRSPEASPRRSTAAAVGVAALSVAVLLSSASCSTTAGSTAPASTPPETLAIGGTPDTVSPVAAATTLPTTVPPTEPPTTEPPTTVPPTTTPPTTTVPPLPSNVEVVGPFVQPLAAVGTNNGEATKMVQLRLAQLGFWVSSADGRYGLETRQAVMAFQKYLGLEASGKVDEATAAFLTNFVERAHGASNTGTLVEVDKARQLLFIVVDGKTVWTFNTSTGNGEEYTEPDKNTPGEVITGVSLTPDGLWSVNRERPEGWWEGDLGEIYRPKYFVGGVAVHGSNSIPNYPASHGCVRVSVPAMDFIWDSGLIPMGTTVWVHNGMPPAAA